jgi:phosphatidylethanolamine/phosphatidyl-N-methylethanolamine N-methyltransferase
MTHALADLDFLRRFLAHPLRVASPVPSGPALAGAIAKQITPASGPVLELGPGTGTVTQAILDRGAAKLVAIENDPSFVTLLRRRFPDSRIVQGDAFQFRRILQEEDILKPFAAVVSGVPVLTQTLAIRRQYLRDAVSVLQPGAPFIQFSYGLRPPLPVLPGMDVRRAQIVWRNVPPMHIWAYRRLICGAT